MKYLTRQGNVILAVVKDSSGHMTADEVYREAKKTLPRIAVGTVYRNLNELAEAGKLRRIRVANAPDIFDRTLTPHEHIHCPICGKTEDLLVEGLDECMKRAVKSEEFTYELTVSAPCSVCRNAKLDGSAETAGMSGFADSSAGTGE